MRETKQDLINRYEAQIANLKVEMNGTAERARAIIDSKEALHKQLETTRESLRATLGANEALDKKLTQALADIARKEDAFKELLQEKRELVKRLHDEERGNRDLRNQLLQAKNLEKITSRALHGLEGTKRDNFGEIALLESENRRLQELINSKNRALKLIRGLCGEENADSAQDVLTPYPNNFPG